MTETEVMFAEAKVKEKEKKESKKNDGNEHISPFKATNIEEFSLAIGKEMTTKELFDAMSQLKVQTIHGEVNMAQYDRIVTAKLFEYVKYGTAKRIWRMMIKQDPNSTTDDLLTILLEMARLEIEYGLRPITHVIPIAGQTYIKADGFLYYAHRSGNLKNITWRDEEKDGAWTSTCVVETNDGAIYEGVATVRPTRNIMDDPREKARTKAMRRALRRAFPIGASDEIYDEFEKTPFVESKPVTVDNPVEDLRQLIGGESDDAK